MEDIIKDQILSNIKSNKKDISTKDKKELSSESRNLNGKKICCAAVRYSTIGAAYKDISEKNIEIYLVTDNNDKTYAYSRCSKTIDEGSDFCHLHNRMKSHNREGLKNFKKDIVPSTPNDKKKILADLEHDFFNNMGKRGAKKKNNDNNYCFKDVKSPILLILTHKNPKLLYKLSIYAEQLLQNINKNINEIDNNESINSNKNEKKKTSNNMKDLISMIESNDIEQTKKSLKKKSQNITNKKSNNNSDEELDNNSNEDSDNESNSTEILEENSEENLEENSEEILEENSEEILDDKLKNISDEKLDDNDDEGLECIELITIDNEKLMYNENDQMIYKLSDDEEYNGIELGLLKEISKKYHTIFHNNKYYTVLIELIHNKETIYCCVLKDKLFNQKLELIGKRIKTNDNEYKLKFSKNKNN